MDEQIKYERFFVRSSMVLEKSGTISEDEKKDLLPILFL
ncbi:hypothetical protein CU002_2892 [Enterococcus faecium]|nr:hypothetical protein [Enterococcus faecium]